MKIGMLTTGYPHHGDPVAGAFVRGMARALAMRGHTVHVLCAALPGDAPRADAGVVVRPVAYGPWPCFYGAGAPTTMASSPTAWLGGAAFTLALASAAAKHLAGCDALVSHFVLPCGLVGGLIHGDRPHLAVVHGTDGLWLARCPPAFRRRVLHGASVVQYTHEGLRRRVGEAGIPTVVRPMGFDPSAMPRQPSCEGEIIALAIGRLVPVKRVDRVIEAVARARTLGAAIRLVVVGDGPERDALKRLPSARDVTFTGALDAKARDAWLAQAHVFVHGAGEGEGAPVAILEAMGAGTPVVAMNGGGVQELVGDGGIIVDSIDAMTAALARLVGDPPAMQALGERAKARAWPLRWEAEAERLETLLRAGPTSCPKVAHS